MLRNRDKRKGEAGTGGVIALVVVGAVVWFAIGGRSPDERRANTPAPVGKKTAGTPRPEGAAQVGDFALAVPVARFADDNKPPAALRVTETKSMTGHPDGITGVTVSPDGGTVASLGWDRGFGDLVKLWDARTGKELATIQPTQGVHFSTHVSRAFTADGKVFVWRFASNWGLRDPQQLQDRVSLWDARTGKLLSSFPLGEAGDGFALDLSLAVSPDGRVVFAGGAFWDVKTGKQLRTIKPESWPEYTRPAFSPDGKTLALCGHTYDAKTGRHKQTAATLWDVDTARSRGALKGYEGDVAFSSDSKKLASVCDGSVRVWDVPGQKELAAWKTGEKDDAGAPEVRFTAQDTRLVTVDWTGAVRLWSIADKREVGAGKAQFPEHVTGIFLAADGKTIAVGSAEPSPDPPVLNLIARAMNLHPKAVKLFTISE